MRARPNRHDAVIVVEGLIGQEADVTVEERLKVAGRKALRRRKRREKEVVCSLRDFGRRWDLSLRTNAQMWCRVRKECEAQ